MQWKHFTDGKQNICLPIFDCLQTEKATRQRRPLLQLKTKQWMLPARRWKRSLQLGICKWDAIEALYRRQTKYLFADLWLFTSVEGDEATSPSFAIRYAAIDASSTSLEAIIATLLPAGGTTKKRPFSDGNQALDCRRIVSCFHRWRAGNAAILRVDPHLQRAVVRAHLSLRTSVAFTTHGNTHLPRWARGPLWCPPSGHFFPSLRSIYPSQSGLIWVAAPFWIAYKIRRSPRLS